MIGVHHLGPNNSTAFTNCCGCAILGYQARCPSCKEFVHPFSEGDENYSEHKANQIRFSYAFRKYK